MEKKKILQVTTGGTIASIPGGEGLEPHRSDVMERELQQIDYDAETGNLVAYSLGDFYGDGVKGGTNYSILLDIEITMDNTNRDTRVTNYSITPIYTLKENECDSQRRVVRIHEAMFAYESNYVDRITGAAYSSMQTALKRIEERIKPPVEEED